MKFQAEVQTSLNTVTAYGADFVEINRQRHGHAVLVTPGDAVTPWEVEGFEALAPAHFEAVLALAPEVVLLGTGTRQRFPHPRLTEALARARIGVEVMDTPAACRTYNILMSEGRRVVAALMLG